MDIFFISQLIGCVAFGFTVGAYQIFSQKKMFAVRSVGEIFWIVHYTLLEGYSAVFTLAIATFRTLAIVFVWPDAKKYIIPLSILIIFNVCYFSVEGGLVRFLPFLASTSIALSMYFHEDFIKCRSIMLFSPVFWLIYGILIHSYPAIIMCSILMVSQVFGMIRFIMNEKRLKKMV